MLKRFSSPVTILSIAAQVLSILVVLNVITPTESEAVNTVIGAVCQLLVTFGVLNNPTDANNF